LVQFFAKKVPNRIQLNLHMDQSCYYPKLTLYSSTTAVAYCSLTLLPLDAALTCLGIAINIATAPANINKSIPIFSISLFYTYFYQ
ncbi:hypothetical protein, partial [Lactobacillus helveticus]|uniref:hypothetical protein n=1 Tax=Lactobacillus helveticus TaxID=1587 RepID=UPI001F2CE9D5